MFFLAAAAAAAAAAAGSSRHRELIRELKKLKNIPVIEASKKGRGWVCSRTQSKKEAKFARLPLGEKIQT